MDQIEKQKASAFFPKAMDACGQLGEAAGLLPHGILGAGRLAVAAHSYVQEMMMLRMPDRMLSGPDAFKWFNGMLRASLGAGIAAAEHMLEHSGAVPASLMGFPSCDAEERGCQRLDAALAKAGENSSAFVENLNTALSLLLADEDPRFWRPCADAGLRAAFHAGASHAFGAALSASAYMLPVGSDGYWLGRPRDIVVEMPDKIFEERDGGEAFGKALQAFNGLAQEAEMLPCGIMTAGAFYIPSFPVAQSLLKAGYDDPTGLAMQAGASAVFLQATMGREAFLQSSPDRLFEPDAWEPAGQLLSCMMPEPEAFQTSVAFIGTMLLTGAEPPVQAAVTRASFLTGVSAALGESFLRGAEFLRLQQDFEMVKMPSFRR